MKKTILLITLFFLNFLTVSAVSESLQIRSISITGSDLEPKFNSNITKYVVRVPYEKNEINIVASTRNKATQLTGTGRDQSVIVGNNIFELVTKNIEGKKATYTIIVSRQDENGNYLKHNYSGLLRSLLIDEVALHFNKNQFVYDLDVPHNIESLNLKPVVYEKDLKLEVKGDKNLKYGKNVVEILTKSQNNIIRTYKLNVKRADKPVETKEKNLYYIIKNNKQNSVSIDLDVPQKLYSQTLEYIYNSEKNIKFNYINNSVKTHSLFLNYQNITNPNMDLNLETKIDYNGFYKEKKAIVFEYSQTIIPVSYNVEINVNGVFEEKDRVLIYSALNKSIQSSKVENDTINFDIDSGGKYYIYKKNSIFSFESIDKDTVIIGILIFFIFLASIRLIVVLKK